MTSKILVYRDYRFNLDEASCLSESDRDTWVGKTTKGTWFIFDESYGEIVAALIEGNPDCTKVDFAQALFDQGYADLVLDHFPEVAEQVIPEA